MIVSDVSADVSSGALSTGAVVVSVSFVSESELLSLLRTVPKSAETSPSSAEVPTLP